MKIKVKRIKRNTPTRVRAGCWVRGAQGDFILWAGAGRSRRTARAALKARMALQGPGIMRFYSA